jgi:TolB protein
MPTTYHLHSAAHRILLTAFYCLLMASAACGPAKRTGALLPTLTPAVGVDGTVHPGEPADTPIPPTPIKIEGQELFILSFNDFGYSHLFAFIPKTLAFVRLTNGPWNDVTPALSPDGRHIAFASDRNNYWNLYVLDAVTGAVTRLTDTKEYDSNPTFSPDGQWIAYETYMDDNLELAIQSLADPGQPPIRLTDDPAVDESPAWSPEGRQIAYVSNRTGESEIWIANLDKTDETRYVDVSRNTGSAEAHPVWSYDGNLLAWGATSYSNGLSGVYTWDIRFPDHLPHWIGDGDWPVWSEDASQIATRVSTPNENYLTAYTTTGELTLALKLLPGTLKGMIWHTLPITDPLPAPFQTAAQAQLAPLYTPQLVVQPDISGRLAIVPLDDVEAPYPRLNDAVDEAFVALRQRVIQEANWDALANLENAYTPITSVLDPGKGEDWLYTGRAFALNAASLSAGWMAVVREDFSQQTYWRLYLRAQAQDGSLGEPLHQVPWDLSARYNLDPQAYEQGGQLIREVPAGYWIDFTDLANQYGWQRLPAFSNWRTYYKGTRFNEFVITGGLDWPSAMLQLYPPEVLVTPTLIVPPTETPSPTQPPKPTRTPSKTPTPNPTFTLHP